MIKFLSVKIILQHLLIFQGMLLFFLPVFSSAQSCMVEGRVVNVAGAPLPYATVRLPGEGKGTIADEDGNFKIEISGSQATLEVRFVGYKTRKESVSCDQTRDKNWVLTDMEYTLEETIVTSDGKDPAYGIMRKAIQQRKYHLDRPGAFQCDVYIKGLQRLNAFPERVLGMKTDMDSSQLGIVYLSESVSEYYFRQPKDVREIMVSSKVSGRNNAFSYNQASDMYVNFYESLINLYELSERGFVSPVAPSSFLYYKFKLLGISYEDKDTLYRIQVIPKRASDPVFAGEIQIAAPDYRFHTANLYITKEARVEFVDTLRFHQVFVPAEKEVWMIGSQRMEFVFSAMGFQGNGQYLTNYFEYKVNPEFPKGFFGKEIMKVNADANLKDSAYWDSIRPIPLTHEEVLDYIEKDSIAKLKEQPEYLDSLDRASNRFRPGMFVLSGHSWYKRKTKTRYSMSPLATGVQYNTVEGWALNQSFTLTRELEGRRLLSMSLNGRYGFASGRPHAYGSLYYRYNPVKAGMVYIAGGQWLRQFDGQNPVPVFLNSVYTLWDEQNLIKLYQAQVIRVGTGREIVNGLNLSYASEVSRRSAMVNHSLRVFRDVADRSFTSNNPLQTDGNALAFPTHVAWIQEVKANIVIGNEYVSRPDAKWNQGSKWPTLELGWQGGIPVSDRAPDFHEVFAYLQDDFSFGMIGKSTVRAGGGQFLSTNRMYFMDYRHFQGNILFIRKSGDLSFQALPYYDYSSNGTYATAHWVHHTGGWLSNKLPLLRKLKTGEYIGVNFLAQSGRTAWVEYIAGIERLGMQLGVVSAYAGGQHTYTGIRIGSRF